MPCADVIATCFTVFVCICGVCVCVVVRDVIVWSALPCSTEFSSGTGSERAHSVILPPEKQKAREPRGLVGEGGAYVAITW